jgi:hypothetical protein
VTPDVKQGVKAACSAPTDKLVVLCAYRRARGLCQFCFEKWSRDYKCALTVQLQTVQKVWELLQLDVDTASCSDHSVAHLNLLSQEVMSVAGSSKTFKFLVSI